MPSLHETVNIIVFFVKSNENAYPKGRAFMEMYRVVPIMKRGNYQLKHLSFYSPLLVGPFHQHLVCWLT